MNLCAHCLRSPRGLASIDGQWVCHPDEGLSCYEAVQFGCPMPCVECIDALHRIQHRIIDLMHQSQTESVRSMIRTLESAL